MKPGKLYTAKERRNAYCMDISEAIHNPQDRDKYILGKCRAILDDANVYELLKLNEINPEYFYATIYQTCSQIDEIQIKLKNIITCLNKDPCSTTLNTNTIESHLNTLLQINTASNIEPITRFIKRELAALLINSANTGPKLKLDRLQLLFKDLRIGRCTQRFINIVQTYIANCNNNNDEKKSFSTIIEECNPRLLLNWKQNNSDHIQSSYSDTESNESTKTTISNKFKSFLLKNRKPFIFALLAGIAILGAGITLFLLAQINLWICITLIVIGASVTIISTALLSARKYFVGKQPPMVMTIEENASNNQNNTKKLTSFNNEFGFNSQYAQQNHGQNKNQFL